MKCNKPDFHIDISSIENEHEERIRKGVEDIMEKNPNLSYTAAKIEYLKDEKTTTHHIPTANHVNGIGLQEATNRDTKRYK